MIAPSQTFLIEKSSLCIACIVVWECSGFWKWRMLMTDAYESVTLCVCCSDFSLQKNLSTSPQLDQAAFYTDVFNKLCVLTHVVRQVGGNRLNTALTSLNPWFQTIFQLSQITCHVINVSTIVWQVETIPHAPVEKDTSWRRMGAAVEVSQQPSKLIFFIWVESPSIAPFPLNESATSCK